MKHFLLILLLPIAPLVIANGQQSPDAPCNGDRSLALRQMARDAFDKQQYEAAAHDFSEALHECPP